MQYSVANPGCHEPSKRRKERSKEREQGRERRREERAKRQEEGIRVGKERGGRWKSEHSPLLTKGLPGFPSSLWEFVSEKQNVTKLNINRNCSRGGRGKNNLVSVLYSAGGHLEHVEMKRLNSGSYSGNVSSLELGMAHALSCWHSGATGKRRWQLRSGPGWHSRSSRLAWITHGDDVST